MYLREHDLEIDTNLSERPYSNNLEHFPPIHIAGAGASTWGGIGNLS